MLSITHFYIFITPLFLCTILVPYVSRLCVRIGGIDTPDDRKIHSLAIPRLGGIAIFSSLLFTVIFFCEINQQLKGFLAGAIVIFLTGLADDLSNLTPRQKFAGEFLAAGLAVFMGGISVQDLGNPFGFGIIELGPVAIPFTIFGIVGLINAINLLDGLDGLAGGVCAIACISFTAISYSSGNSSLFSLSLILLGSLIGFLRYNSYPAKIFMGDGGSLLLGYCMGVFSVVLASGGTARVSPYIPLLIMGLPILDTLVVMIKRKREKKRLFMPDKTHLHHKLLDLGIGHKYTVFIVIGISYLMNIVAIFGCRLNATAVCNFNDTTLLFLLAAIAISAYGGLRLVTKWGSGSFNFASNQSLRSTDSYRRLIHLTTYLVSGIKVLIIAILMLPAFLSHNDIEKLTVIPLVMLVLSIIIILSRHSWGNLLLQLFLYCISLLLIFALENYGRNELVLGVPLLTVSHTLFAVLMIFEGVKIFVRRRTAHLIVSRFEYLILLIVLSAPLLPQALTGQFHLMTVAAKAVILFVAFKLILMRQITRNRKILLAIMLTILIMVGRYFSGA